jgi:hypothetical protein
MIDESKYEGRTEGKWEYDSATIHATAKGGNEIIAEYPCWNYNKDQLITKEEEANLRLMADAPLLLEELKRLQHRLMLAESALGEIRAYHESGSGDLGEIIQHYRDNEGVEMPNAFDEDDDSSYTVEGDD